MNLFLKYIHLVVFIVFAHNALGIITGFSLARIFKLPSADQKTLAIETGIQNSGLGLGLIFAFLMEWEEWQLLQDGGEYGILFLA